MTEEKKKRGRPKKVKEAEAGRTDSNATPESLGIKETESEVFVIAEKGPEPKGMGATLEKLSGKLNKAAKGMVLRPAFEERMLHNRIPTGVIELDLKLRGGWPVGCLNVLYGPPSSGKSLLVLESIASAQSFCRKCLTPFSKEVSCDCEKNDGGRVLYVDAESSWTNEWSSEFGIDLSRVIVGHPAHAEQAFDVMELFIKENAIDLIICDSVAGLCPKDEFENSMEKWQTGLVPRLYTKFLRKWATRLSLISQSDRQKYPSIIFINQIRKKMNVPPYMNPEIMPGGDAQYFFASDIIRVSKKGVEMSSDKKDPTPLYQTIKFVVEKSKVSSAKLEGTFDVPIHKYVDADGRTRNVGEVDNDKTIMEYARKFDVLKTVPLETRGKKYVTLDEVEKDIRGNVSLRWALFKIVNEAYANYIPSLAAGERNAEEE